MSAVTALCLLMTLTFTLQVCGYEEFEAFEWGGGQMDVLNHSDDGQDEPVDDDLDDKGEHGDDSTDEPVAGGLTWGERSHRSAMPIADTLDVVMIESMHVATFDTATRQGLINHHAELASERVEDHGAKRMT